MRSFQACLFALFAASCGARHPNALPEWPSVLFIAVDDLNVDLGAYGELDDLNVDLGAYGEHPTAKTPNIDRLASQGVRFDRAYAQDPLCNPSRTSLLSGRRPASTQVYGNFVEPRSQIGSVVMLPEHFRTHGYFTARVGKIAHGRYEDSVEWDISEMPRGASITCRGRTAQRYGTTPGSMDPKTVCRGPRF